jgi:putative alpha-1,2-mannosidase
LPGNDDLGATSSWAVFAYLGLYPEIPGVAGLTLNTPTFPGVTLKLGGHDLRIRAEGAPDRAYIRSVVLDGKRLQSYWLDWERLKNASVLEFALSGEPPKEVGDAPPSFAPPER